MITGWLLTKIEETAPDGHKPLVSSLSVAWAAPTLPLPGQEWMLAQVKAHAEVIAYIKQDEDFIWIGNEWSKPPQQLLDAYASLLDPNETYNNLGQVLDKLAEQGPRFLLRVQ